MKTGIAAGVYRTHMDAKCALDHLGDIAYNYGRLTVADVKEEIGDASTYDDNKVGWTLDEFECAATLPMDDDHEHYTIILPIPNHFDAPSSSKITYRDYSPRKYTPNPTKSKKSINIAVITKEIENPDQSLKTLFDYINSVNCDDVNVTVI